MNLDNSNKKDKDEKKLTKINTEENCDSNSESESDNESDNNSEDESEDGSEDASDTESISLNENIDESNDKQIIYNKNGTEKKKRGRKKKIIDESLIVPKSPKKRGRKPKDKDIVLEEKIPKKRGRKPKEKIYSVKELPKTFFEENKTESYILHLPIQKNDTNNIPVPNINNDSKYSIYDEKMNNYKVNDLNLLPTQSNLLNNSINDNNYEMVFDSDDIINDNIINDSIINDNTINDKIKNINIDISKTVDTNDYIYNTKNLTNNNNDIFIKEEKEDESKINKIIKKNLKNILYEFINANNDKTWPESTNTHCWWCCHQFTCMPCSLPEYYKKDKFYVSGCFCSFNCTASYNFSKNDDDVWERYTLLNLMYKKLYNQKLTKINLAPPRETLKMFGGYLSIEEFRENSLKNDKTFVVIKPPLISIIPKIEENISNTGKNFKNNNIQINESILNKTQNNLKLKRNKPVTNPNSTLQSFMDLKVL